MFKSRQSSKVREASHAGSWYSANPSTLRNELQKYWDNAASKLSEHGGPPVPSARVIISPHAGYRYSGPTAGVAYRALDITPSTRHIFVIGPSHHVYLSNATVSTCAELATPLGNLTVNRSRCDGLRKDHSDLFGTVSKEDEEAEHSLEMQYPFLRFAIDKALPSASPSALPTITPIMVGNASPTTERALGTVLAPYFSDPSTLFIISSDFAHWGKRFNYTYYMPSPTSPPSAALKLRKDNQVDPAHPIHASIKQVDHLSIEAIKGGKHEEFTEHLRETGNTVCGRHPIGVVMCAVEVSQGKVGSFVFTDYSRSGEVEDVEDSSVSYASAFAKG